MGNKTSSGKKLSDHIAFKIDDQTNEKKKNVKRNIPNIIITTPTPIEGLFFYDLFKKYENSFSYGKFLT